MARRVFKTCHGRGGADGLLIETHNDPSSALYDGEQSVIREQLAEKISVVKKNG